nr:MAG TPA: hypothetical protein [Caudoviricetes sp.]
MESCGEEAFMKTGMVLLAAPVASADAKLLLSVATKSNQRTPRGGLLNVESGRQPPLDSPAAKVSCVKELLSTT